MTDEKETHFFDEAEPDLIESFEAALESGALRPSPESERVKASVEWRALVEEASARKAIPSRLQTRDMERLEVMARQRGLPYQTLVASVLHPFVTGALVEGNR